MNLNKPVTISVPFNLELLAMFDQLEKGLQMSKEEIIKYALFLYYPQVLIDAEMDCVKVLLFLNKIEAFWLKSIARSVKKSEVEVLIDIMSSESPQKNPSNSSIT